MQGDVRDKLWRQLESEILLQRHKTVVRACRRNSIISNNSEIACPKPNIPAINEENAQNFGDVRTVIVKRRPGQGLGISITVRINLIILEEIYNEIDTFRVDVSMVFLFWSLN